MTPTIPAPNTNEPFVLEALEPQRWYHIYSTETHPTRADSFNEGWGRTRFAPIKTDLGEQIHTYYAASTIRCAMMESILHDVPLNPPGMFQMSRLPFFHLATIELRNPLQAVSFHSLHLPRLKLTRTMLIESLPAYYDQTSAWAKAAYEQAPAAAAIVYGSRRDDAGNCVMLFKQRLPDATRPFVVVSDEPLSSPKLSRDFLALTRQLDVSLSP